MRWLLIFFVALLLASGLPGWMRKIGLGRLPGDLHFSVFGREVRVRTAVDPALIGGAVIDAGDLVIDGSLKGKLERLQTALTH